MTAFARGAVPRLSGAGLATQDVTALLERVEQAVPHLNFGRWSARKSSEDDLESQATWKGTDNKTIEICIALSGLALRAQCKRDDSAISRDDMRFLSALTIESSHVLKNATDGALSLVDFGTEAVADDLRQRADLDYDTLPLLRFVRSLGQETYENQRLSYGVVMSGLRGDEGAPVSAAFDNKRFKRISDGFSTALVVDAAGRINELLSLPVPRGEALSRRKRPWWAAGLAEAANSEDGVGVALTRNGDILVVSNGALAFTQRAGKWRKWDHAAILRRLRSQWDFRGRPLQVNDVLSYLYHLALDLSFRRSGALLVVAGSEKKATRLLTSRADRMISSVRKEPEKSLDSSLATRAIQRSDRRVAADLAGLDGALVVDRTGKLLAYGAMTQSAGSAHQGARTRAAIAASRHGVVIKVSSDGDITFFRQGKEVFTI